MSMCIEEETDRSPERFLSFSLTLILVPFVHNFPSHISTWTVVRTVASWLLCVALRGLYISVRIPLSNLRLKIVCPESAWGRNYSRA